MSSSLTDRLLLPVLTSRLRARATLNSSSAATLSDEEIVLRIESGDRAALALLFDRFSDLIMGIGLKLLRDRAEAEDLVQDVFVHLFEKVRGFDPTKGSGRTWLIQIAYRRAFDRRKYLARRHFSFGTDADSAGNTQEEHFDVESRLYEMIAGEEVHRAFDQLNPEQRNTLEMYFFEGCELREISERMGETLENVRHYYYRGLERLRRACFGASR